VALAPGNPYPLAVDIPYEPFAKRLSAFFRLLLAIPALAFLYSAQQVASLLGFFAWVCILITGRYPQPMWRFNFTFLGWLAQGWGYLALLTDEYPPLGPGAHAIRVRSAAHRPAVEGETAGEDMPPPQSSRWRVFFRYLLVLPQVVVLFFVNIAGAAATFLTWIAIIFSGRRPEGLTSFVGSVLRWNTRVIGYTLFLRDEYPPYGGAPDAETTGRRGETAAAAIGGLAAAAIVAVVAVSIANQPDPVRETIAYADATSGNVENRLAGVTFEPAFADGQVLLFFTGGGGDPPDDVVAVEKGRRLVKFTWEIQNDSDDDIGMGSFEMWVEAGGETYDAFELRAAGRRDYDLPPGQNALVEAFFEVPEDAVIDRLAFAPFLTATDIEVTFTR
jgi:hypothetical protein